MHYSGKCTTLKSDKSGPIKKTRLLLAIGYSDNDIINWTLDLWSINSIVYKYYRASILKEIGVELTKW